MGSQLRWLERTPDKREVDGSIPFEPTIDPKRSKQHIEKYIEKRKGKLEYSKDIKDITRITIKPK